MKDRTSLSFKILKPFLLISGLLLFFWWPLSHWLYSDWYHTLLGFRPGSYQDSMVKMIGTCGMFPVLLALLSSKNPTANRAALITLIVSALLLGMTFIYLISSGVFPQMEYVNVFLCFALALALTWLFPWRNHA